jgi:pantetheine-phosphate adenylyltransferase
LRTALFPGSFDPFHNGHLEIVEAASKLFGEVVVAPMRNTQKGEPLFTLEERKEMISESVAHLPNVRLAPLSSLVVDLAREIGADVIVKGLRVASDAEAELQQAQMNRKVAGIETLFIPSSSEYSFIASKYVRDFARFGGADRVEFTVPEPVLRKLREKFSGDVVSPLRGAAQAGKARPSERKQAAV